MRKSIALLLVLVFLTASCIIAPLPVNAGSRTLVVPDDYQTISSAIGNATDGDMIFVKKGTYKEETLEINKNLSLIGEDVNNTIIKLHPPVYNVTQILTQFYAALSNAITINANDFRLLNLTIALNPDGYIAVAGDRTQIIGNNIAGTGSVTGLLISGSYCNITDNISGGFISSNGSANLIARNSVYKIIIDGESNTIGSNTICNLHLSNTNKSIFYENKIGLATLYYNGFSVLGREYSGICIEGNSFHNIFYANNIAAYSYDVEIKEINSKSENNTFYHNNFLNNSRYTGVGVRTGNFVNFWDNEEEGNFWDDYNGTDYNRDGIGDAPYTIDVDNVDRYPLMAPFDIENDTVVLPPPEPFPTTLVVAAVATVAVIGAVLAIYFKKRNRQAENDLVKKP
jgi:nitrous oxidase accessory protein